MSYVLMSWSIYLAAIRYCRLYKKERMVGPLQVCVLGLLRKYDGGWEGKKERRKEGSSNASRSTSVLTVL